MTRKLSMQTEENTSFLKKYGLATLNNGYPVIPIRKGYKYPQGVKDWRSIKANGKLIKKWYRNGFSDGGVGVLTGEIVALDLDILDEEYCEHIIAYIEEKLGQTLLRYGNRPKALLVYRTNTPFTKIASKKYTDLFGQENKLEALGDGQQFVAYAEHPDTKEPYEWRQKGVADIHKDELISVNESEIREIISYFEENIPDDWEIIDKKSISNQLIENDHPDDSIVNDLDDEDHFIFIDSHITDNIKPALDIDTDQLKQALFQLDPDMKMNDWVKIGMAIWHQYDGHTEGFELWDQWSQQGEKYAENKNHEMTARWKSFESNLAKEPVTAATILKLASNIKKKQRKSLIKQFLKRYIYIEHGDLVCDLEKPPYCFTSRLLEFKNATANVRHEIPAPTIADPDKTKLDPVWKAWLVNEKRLSAQGTTYLPDEGKTYKDKHNLLWVNEFYMPPFNSELYVTIKDVTILESFQLFIDHMIYLFPVENEREWFLDWMAFNLQFPGKRSRVTPLHVTMLFGAGRGWTLALLGHLVGQWNMTKTKMEILAGEGNAGAYNEYLDRSLICAIEEVRENNKRFSVSDKIRDTIEADYLEINTKYGKKGTKRVFTNFFFMSNHPDAMVIPHGDRRINVFFGPSEPKDEAYYDRLYAMLETPVVEYIYGFLMSRDLSKFNWKTSMKNNSRERMIDNNRSDTERLFFEFLDNPAQHVMTVKQIIESMRNDSEELPFDIDVDEAQLIKLLQHHARGPYRIKWRGKMTRVWQLKGEAKYDNASVREMLEQYEGME